MEDLNLNLNLNGIGTGTCLLNVKDDVQLDEVDVPDVPKDIIFPDELNRYLRDKIRHLTYENGMLKKNLTENESLLKASDTKVSLLSSQLEKYNSTSNFSLASDVASSKIVELSKRLREKSSELESLKTKYSKLETKLIELQRTEEDKKERKTDKEELDTIPVKEHHNEEIKSMEDELKKLNDKLSSTNTKLFEALNANKTLKNDLQIANKLIQQEIGERESLDLINLIKNGGSGWRGRSQIICDLQQKNAELKDKLKQANEKLEKKDTNDSNKSKSVEKKLQILSKENLQYKMESGEFKKKLEALKARIRVLDMENAVVKAKLNTLNDNSERDQQLINTLTGQLSNLQNSQSEALKQKQSYIMKLEKENKVLQLDLSREAIKTENLEKEVLFCRQEMEKRKEKHASSLPFPMDSSNSNNMSYIEAEKKRLLELISISNERLEKEREQHTQLQIQYRNEKQKAAKLESKLARIKIEQNYNDKASNYSSSSFHTTNNNNTINNNSNKSKETEKEKSTQLENKLELAEEQIKALKTRLEIEKNERQLDFAEFSKILNTTTNFLN